MSDQEKRIIDLEKKLAFQDYTIQELNSVVISQQEELTVFSKKLEAVTKRLTELDERLDNTAVSNNKPPHY